MVQQVTSWPITNIAVVVELIVNIVIINISVDGAEVGEDNI